MAGIVVNHRPIPGLRHRYCPPDFLAVKTSQILFNREFGRLRPLAVSPDGYLYFTTNNPDSRGGQ